MSDYEEKMRSSGEGSAVGEEETRQLLQSAGRRQAVAAEDLAMIKAAARVEWRAMVEQKEARRPGFRVLLPVALAASLVLVLAVGWWMTVKKAPATLDHVASVELLIGEIRAQGPLEWEREAIPQLAIGDSVPAGAELTTIGELDGQPALMALRLSGGQSVRLDTGTKVRFVSSRRLELERGAVYVDSEATAAGAGAVEVVTAFGTVQEIGTQFEVRVDDGEAATLRLRVREGTVSLLQGDASHSVATGEELTFHHDGSVARGTVERHGSAWKWILAAAPSLDIEGQTLRSYLEWVSRETGWRVRYADPALAESAATIELHGTIEGLAPDESASVVLPGSGLDYRVESGTLLVTRPSNGGDGA